jgi:hypothetical protein
MCWRPPRNSCKEKERRGSLGAERTGEVSECQSHAILTLPSEIFGCGSARQGNLLLAVSLEEEKSSV